MKRLNFTLDDDTVALLDTLSDKYYQGNKSRTIREALQSLAAHTGHDGWVISGYSPVRLEDDADCYTCGTHYEKGDVLYHPVFERGSSPSALHKLPKENWLDCSQCVERNVGDQATV